MQHPKTVKIIVPVSDDNPHGYIVINEADLAEDHDLFKGDDAEDAPDEAARKAERAALFAFLKENGVPVAKNSTDEALRAKAEEIKAKE
jgi:hypothetical protein